MMTPSVAEAADVSAVVTGFVSANSASGIFAGSNGAFTATFVYDDSVIASAGGSSFFFATDKISYSGLKSGSLTVGGKTFTGENFYQALAFSSPGLAAQQGFGGVGLSYNFYDAATNDALIFNFSLYGPVSDFNPSGVTILSTPGATANNLSSDIFSRSQGSLTAISNRFMGPTVGSMSLVPARLTISAESAVPEPASWVMMIVGMGVVGFATRRRKRKVEAVVRFA